MGHERIIENKYLACVKKTVHVSKKKSFLEKPLKVCFFINFIKCV